MKFRIAAITEGRNIDMVDVDDKKDIEIISGKLGSICYLEKDYNAIAEEDDEKSLKRFNRITSNGHHSIADHCYVTIVFENISKMQAMVLNSTQCYNTSEKSARYTVFKNNTPQEDLLYNKWKNYIIENNEELGLNIEDEKKLEKIANENARYFLSVFNKSTTMAYTASVRQWNYLIDWLYAIDWLYSFEKISRDMKDTSFNRNLKSDLHDLLLALMASNIYIEGLRDNKDRHLSFLSKQTRDISLGYCHKDNFNVTYNTTYKASFAQLAQAQRHRTIKYYMMHDGSEDNEYFIPYFIKDQDTINEWISDMETIETPQGLLVYVTEVGTLENFLLKCKERLCYRAQVEICKQTANTLVKYYEEYISKYDTPSIIKEEVDKYIKEKNDNLCVQSKCSILGECKESCGHAKDFLDRTY